MASGPSAGNGWTTTTAGKLAQKEFAFQRMHREPPPPLPPPPRDSFVTEHGASFRAGMFPKQSTASQARYTVGTNNALGTHTTYRKVQLDEVRVNQVHFGDDASQRGWESTFSSSFAKPDHSHRSQGAGTSRSGMAPRLPFSEVERNFGALTSEGTLPGTVGKREGTSEQRTAYRDPGAQPRNVPTLTLGFGNDISTSVSYQKTPALLADMTHYSLGSEPRRYETATMAATQRPVLNSKDRLKAAGEMAPLGPSEVERGFKQQLNSRHYNIINNGERLHGELNSDAALYSKTTRVHDPNGFHPIGRSQHPCVNPRDRGPTGLRQAYDIITGVDRPKERW